MTSMTISISYILSTENKNRILIVKETIYNRYGDLDVGLRIHTLIQRYNIKKRQQKKNESHPPTLESILILYSKVSPVPSMLDYQFRSRFESARCLYGRTYISKTCKTKRCPVLQMNRRL